MHAVGMKILKRPQSRLAALAVAAGLSLSACGGATAGVTSVYGTADSDQLEVRVDTCEVSKGDVTASETATEITIKVEGEHGENCRGTAVITLDAPLGDRAIIDDATGDEVLPQLPQ